MGFNIRAISLVASVAVDARVSTESVLGKEIEFRAGLRYSITMPAVPAAFAVLTEPEKTLSALAGWARLYRYPDGKDEKLHIIAPADNENGDLVVYRVDLRQPAKPRRALRPPVELIASSVMTYDECASWLVELSRTWTASPDQKLHQFVLARPGPLPPAKIRVAWVGPEIAQNVHMPGRLAAIGAVYGAEITHVAQRTYRETEALLEGLLPLDAVIVCQQFARHIGSDVVPDRVYPSRVHVCDSTVPADLEQQILAWIEIAYESIETGRTERTSDERDVLLSTMLRGMLSHSKIGQFNHCPKQTVLKGVRARRLNVPAAERILDENSEAHQDTKDSDSIFLWKDHHDGRQYFLNSRLIERITTLVSNNVR
jgi:hypothetical protein